MGYFSNSFNKNGCMRKSQYSHPQKILQKLLRQIRLDAGLRQKDLAERLEKPQSFISKYESGERRLDLVELHQICNMVGVSLEEFARKFEEETKKTGHAGLFHSEAG